MLKSLCLALHLCSSVSGYAQVVDADTIIVEGYHIRLSGIDGPELSEAMGLIAKKAMQNLTSGQIIRCELNGEKSYKRLVGTCYLPDDKDIGEYMVSAGLALDCARYSFGKYRRFEPTLIRAIIKQHPYC